MRLRSSKLRVRLQPLVLTLALPLLAACGDDGPSGPDDGVDQNIQDIATSIAQGKADVVDDNPQVTSAQGLKDAITGVSQTLPASSALRAGREATLSLASAGAAFLVPRGVTCIWSLEEDQYVGDPNDPGTAPQSGIRFRLYTLDAPGNPAAPLDDIGLIDVIPLQDGDQVDVTLDSEDAGGGKALQVDLDGTITQSALSLSKQGSASANDKTLSWTYDVEASQSQFTTDLKATLADIAAEMLEDVASDETSELTAEVRARGKTIRYVATLDGSAIQSGTVSVDGTEVGQLSGSRGSASVSGTQQNADFEAIFDAVTDMDVFALNMTSYALETLPPEDSAAQSLRSDLKFAL